MSTPDTCAKRRNQWIFVLLLALIAGTMLYLNLHTPLQMDDYDYSISWATGKPVSGLFDVIASQAEHYKLWGGRSVVHALAQTFLYWGKGIFNVLNTAMYVLLLLEIYALSKPKGKAYCWPILALEHAFFMLFLPFFGTVFLWLDGACNYLWGTALGILPLLLYRNAAEGGFFSRRGGILAVVLSFLAGWTNENTACGVLAVIGLLLLMDWKKKRPVRPWQAAALFAQAAGAALMILAPGNFARASVYSYDSMILELIKRLAIIVLYTGLYTVILWIGAAFLLWKHRGTKARMAWAAILFAGALLSAFAMVASPELSDRSLTSTVVLTLAACLTLAGDVKMEKVALVLLILTAARSVQAAGAVRAHEARWQIQLDRIQQAVSEGEESVAIDSVPSESPFTMSIMLSENPDEWPNKTLSKWFGVKIQGNEL